MKYPKTTLYLSIIWVILAIGVGYKLVERINVPIKFEKEREKRENAAIQRLIDIREAQKAHKKVMDERDAARRAKENIAYDMKKDTIPNYAPTLDSLINFVKYDHITKIDYNTIPGVEWNADSFPDKANAAKLGMLEEIVVEVLVLNEIFGKDYPIDSLKYVPFSNGKYEFNMKTAVITTGAGVKEHVFQADIEYKKLFEGMNNQMVINYIVNRRRITNSDLLKVGSLTRPNMTGNWEK
ncbi:MAG: hypothetical protein JW801_10995 [Bacteroidales bacterium]|nr:hypothetical protein [Bacteroidales bacterium]